MTKSPWDEYLDTAHKQYEAILKGERYKFEQAITLQRALGFALR